MVNTSDRTVASPEYLALVRAPTSRLADVMQRGDTPDLDQLVGWEWRGTNMPASTALMGLRRFIKGFERVGSIVEGYNVTVPGHDLTTPWADKRRRDGRREWARFGVAAVDPTSIDNRYLGAVLIDYSKPAQPEAGIPSRLRDYVVRVTPEADDLLLGRSYLAVGQRRIPLGWFALERLRPVN
jgi:hypothetical protein